MGIPRAWAAPQREGEVTLEPAPRPEGEDLPDLTAPSLYAAARQTPIRMPPPAVRPTAPESRSAMPVRDPQGKALAGPV